jgi:hypothetical protein
MSSVSRHKFVKGKAYGKSQECRQAREEESIGCQEGRLAEENASEEEGSGS